MGYQVFPEPAPTPVDITTYGFAADSVPATPTRTDVKGWGIYEISTSIAPGVFKSETTPSHTVGVVVFGSTNASAFTLTPSNTAAIQLSLATTQSTYGLWINLGYQSNSVGNGSGFSISTSRAVNYQLVNNVLFLCKGNVNDAGESAIAISTNGSSWEINRLGFATAGTVWANSAWYDGSKYYVQTRVGVIQASTDLVNWSTHATGFMANAVYGDTYYDTTLGRHIAAGGPQFADKVFTSTDAINWTTNVLNFVSSSQGQINKVKRLNNLLFAVGAKNSNLPLIAVSTDATNWTDVTPNDVAIWSTAASPIIWEMEYINGRYVVASAGNTSQGLTSTDGVNWSTVSVPGVGAYTASFNDGEYVYFLGNGSTAGGTIWTTNGINFSTATIYGKAPNPSQTLVTTQSERLNFAAYSSTGLSGNKYFVLGGSNSTTKGGGTIGDLSGTMRYQNYYSSNRVGTRSQTFNLIVNRYNLSIDAR